MFCMLKTKKICPAYVSKRNSNRNKDVIVLMILNRERRHYLTVKKSALLMEITSKTNADFYCLNCLYSFRTKNKLESR